MLKATVTLGGVGVCALNMAFSRYSSCLTCTFEIESISYVRGSISVGFLAKKTNLFGLRKNL